jgi:ribonuclease P protein component
VSGNHFVVFGLSGRTPCSRLGITATKKLGHAAARNRVKRVVREIFRNNRATTDLPVDIVVNVRSTAVGTPYAGLEKDLLSRISELRRRLRT